MLARFFHAWERRLADASKDRVVRPFEWGTDWIGGPTTGQSREAVERWVDEVMGDTDAFFSAPSTDQYAFDGHTLRFPSALTTPHPENNTVHARWFPASDYQTQATSHQPGRAVLVLPQWNSDAEGHIGLSKLLAQCGISALRLSLPYHDVRMPPELTRADYIVSSNVVRTLQVCRQAVVDARRAIAWLHGQGFRRIGILGTSLGSCLSMLTSAHEPLITAQALNHVSPFFADVVWRGLSTRHVRQGLDGHIDLETLRHLWRPISPWSHLDRAGRTKSLLVYAKYDLTFPVDLSELLVDEWTRRGHPVEVAAMSCGHYSIGATPFKYLDAYVLVSFLRRSL